VTTLPSLSDDDLVRLGLYEPDEPGAAERLTLIRMALDNAATVDEIREAIAERRLHALAAVRMIEGGTERLTLAEAAARAGVSTELAHRVWRALGLAEPEESTRSCSELDVDALAIVAGLLRELGDDTTFQIARAMGSSLARLADAEVAATRAGMEAPLRSGGSSDLDVARAFVRVAEELVPASAFMIDVVHRHHLAASGRRYALWGTAPTPESTTDAVVGFADLVGFTAIGQQLEPSRLDQLVVQFEEVALRAATRPRARLVKLIGDEAMFVAGDADDAVDIARCLMAAPELPAIRAGIASGTVVTREGDLFGPVVNLAARLVALAEPGGILVDAETARRANAVRVRPRGAQRVQGIDEPVEVYEVDGDETRS
jgi:class 3 adenylate cyclase